MQIELMVLPNVPGAAKQMHQPSEDCEQDIRDWYLHSVETTARYITIYQTAVTSLREGKEKQTTTMPL